MKSSSVDQALYSGRVKPQKPVKPRNLCSVSKNKITSLGQRSHGPSTTCENVLSSSVQLSCVDGASQHEKDEVKKSYGQNGLHSDVTQSALWTNLSTELILPSSSDSIVLENSTNCSESRYRQDCPRSTDNRLTSWTAVSTASVSPSVHNNRISQSSETDTLQTVDSNAHNRLFSNTETNRGHDSPRCNGDQPAPWTQPSPHVFASQEVLTNDRHVPAIGDDHIEPPIIYDLLPANAHIQRGEALRLVAQFTAFPPAEISWYRANDLLQTGTSPFAISSVSMV